MLIPKGALVISCQARADNPLHGPVYMSAMAQAAEAGGARGIRANGEADVAAIRAVTKLPIIGIAKVWDDRFPVYITPGFEQAAQVARAGADIVGIDATPRPRNGEPVDRLIGRIKAELGREVFADIATLEEGRAAQAAGATYVATTLAGYTEETAVPQDGRSRPGAPFGACGRGSGAHRCGRSLRHARTGGGGFPPRRPCGCGGHRSNESTRDHEEVCSGHILSRRLGKLVTET